MAERIPPGAPGSSRPPGAPETPGNSPDSSCPADASLGESHNGPPHLTWPRVSFIERILRFLDQREAAASKHHSNAGSPQTPKNRRS